MDFLKNQLAEELIRLAMQEAAIAVEEGNYPFGAVIINLKGEVIATAHNTQVTDSDPTAHAEINLIRKLGKVFLSDDFSRTILVSNAESCSMCFSAAIKAGIRIFIFGAPSEPHMDPYLTVHEIAKYCHEKIEIRDGVLVDECRQQIADARGRQNHLAQ